MPPDPKPRLETLVRQIDGVLDPAVLDGEEEPRDVSRRDAEALVEFARRLALAPEQRGHYRQLALIQRCTRIAEHAGPLVDVLDDRAAVDRILGWIHDNYWPDDINDPDPGRSVETDQFYRIALKAFGRLMTQENGDDPPSSMAHVTSGLPENYDPMPSPADVLDWRDDVYPMIDACLETRDKALIAVAFEAGLRSGELEELCVGDVTDSKYSTKVFVDGKTGRRGIDLIVSIPYLNRWLDLHPEHPDGDPSSRVWIDADTHEAITYQAFLQIFKRAGERAGIDKPVNPTAFRKANTRWLIRQGAPTPLIEDRQGRVRGSKHVARYVARFSDEAESMYADLHGIEIDADEAPPEMGPIECPRCDRQTPREKPLCVWCSQALSPTAAEQADQHDATLDESFADVATAAAEGEVSAERVEDLVEHLTAARELIGDDPELRAAVLAGDATAADDDGAGTR
jgi:hypothetical protein